MWMGMVARAVSQPSTSTPSAPFDDHTFKNPNPEEAGLKQGCIYYRTYTIRRLFHKNPKVDAESQPTYIFYHNFECYDMDLVQMGETQTEFSYDDHLLSESESPKLFPLPKGCPAPVVSRTPTECENGIKLGKHIVSDISQVLTKEMAENPIDVLLPSDVSLEHPDKITQVKIDLDSLEEDVKLLMNSFHDDMPNAADETEKFPNGVEKRVYSFPNSVVVVHNRAGGPELPSPGSNNEPIEPEHAPPYVGPLTDPEGNEVVATLTNGLGPKRAVPGETLLPKDMNNVPEGFYHSKTLSRVHEDSPDSPVVEEILLETMVTKDPRRHVTKRWSRDPRSEEEFTYKGMVERMPNVVDGSTVSEASYIPGEDTLFSVVDAPLRYFNPSPPGEINLTAEDFNKVGNMVENFTQALQDIVTEKAVCMLDKIFHQKTYKIELVCGESAATDDHFAILQNDIVKEVFCGGGSCNDFMIQVRDQMLAHNNNPDADKGEFKIDSGTYKSDIIEGAVGGN